MTMFAVTVFGLPLFNVIIAIAMGYGIIRFGLMMLRGMAAPIPEPPPPGELRKVKIQFQCQVCGTEVRMTMSPNEEPEAPRHCMQEMDLLAPVNEL